MSFTPESKGFVLYLIKSICLTKDERDEHLHCTDIKLALDKAQNTPCIILFEKYAWFVKHSVISYLGIAGLPDQMA